MDDSSELQARIARLAARINRHKSAETSPPTFQSSHYSPGRLRADDWGQAWELKYKPFEEKQQSWVPQRGTPYGVPRGRGRNLRPGTHRNRTLIVNASHQEAEHQGAEMRNGELNKSGITSDGGAQPGWVTKQDRHMQLINNTVYEQKTKERTRAMEETRRQKQIAREEQEKAKINNHLQALANTQGPASPAQQHPTAHHIVVKNIRFIVADGGSKLIKVKDDANASISTPKRANVGGVTFLRSRNGNLYRAGLVKTMRRAGIRKISEPCAQFSTTGSCAKGPQCRYTHDPEKVAICRDFLQTGKCQAGDDCDLSHDPKPERVPACLHFLRGNCTNPDCRYAHVKTNPGAPVCRAFATYGYCSKGAECAERHVHECPDYANKGVCRNSKCRLPHVDRAGQLRKAAANENAVEDEGSSSDVSSDAGLDSDDVDSDEFDEDMIMRSDANTPQLSQQDDFVHF